MDDASTSALDNIVIDRPIFDPADWRLSDFEAALCAETRALAQTGPLFWRDAETGQDQLVDMSQFGDVVLGRKDIGTSYHLSVVVDDALDQITLVTRGADLRASTHVHRLLQALLDLPTPSYLHHQLICDPDGRRLAKRDAARSISHLRESGAKIADIYANMPPIPQILQQQPQQNV